MVLHRTEHRTKSNLTWVVTLLQICKFQNAAVHFFFNRNVSSHVVSFLFGLYLGIKICNLYCQYEFSTDILAIHIISRLTKVIFFLDSSFYLFSHCGFQRILQQIVCAHGDWGRETDTKK